MDLFNAEESAQIRISTRIDTSATDGGDFGGDGEGPNESSPRSGESFQKSGFINQDGGNRRWRLSSQVELPS